jgi:hypothetical protein
MSHKIVHGFAWIAYPDTFGLETEEATDPGHPFQFGSSEVKTPEEVLYYRALDPSDAGIRNTSHTHAYLMLTKLQLHPRLSSGWESEPATLTDKFKTGDGKVKMAKMVQTHRRHAGDLLECELSIEEERPVPA